MRFVEWRDRMIQQVEEVNRASACDRGQGVEHRVGVAREAGREQMAGVAVGVRQRRTQGCWEVSSLAAV